MREPEREIPGVQIAPSALGIPSSYQDLFSGFAAT
jgi:hypothetical protein